jgi:AhpD family alkylhydroperoxidase
MSSIYPLSTTEIRHKRRDLAPNQQAAFEAFSNAAFADGALSAKFKQIIAVAVAHVTQCPYCIEGHTKAALRAGVSPEELMEAIWVAAEMRAGGAYAHSTLMLATLAQEDDRKRRSATQS